MIRCNLMNGQTIDSPIKFNLPVDEDDYLMPTPGPNGQISYVEVMNNHANGDLRRYPINVNDYPNCPMPQACIDNPEYLLMNNRPPDHQYYNELEWFQRELQPLHRSETTV